MRALLQCLQQKARGPGECLPSWTSRFWGGCLMLQNGDVGPVVGRDNTQAIVYHTSHVRFAQKDAAYLLDRQPGDIVDQLLLGFLVGLQTCIALGSCVSCYHLLLG